MLPTGRTEDPPLKFTPEAMDELDKLRRTIAEYAALVPGANLSPQSKRAVVEILAVHLDRLTGQA
jgi:Na+/phosphate symporter